MATGLDMVTAEVRSMEDKGYSKNRLNEYMIHETWPAKSILGQYTLNSTAKEIQRQPFDHLNPK
jgi:hypothetical protein